MTEFIAAALVAVSLAAQAPAPPPDLPETEQAPAYVSIVRNDYEGVSISVSAVSPTGLTLSMVNLSTNDASFSDFYFLEAQNTDGVWQQVPLVERDEPYDWAEQVSTVPPDSAADMPLNWEHLYGMLSPGAYRLVKNGSIHLDENSYALYQFDDEFTIE